MKRILIALITIGTLITAALPFMGQPAYAVGPSWPTSWTLMTDPATGGPCSSNPHRDVDVTYYALDNDYLYLRMQTVDPPGWPWNSPKWEEARYKWWFDTAGDSAYVSGTSVLDAEFQMILEDLTLNTSDPTETRDELGELTLMDDLGNVGFMARWNSSNPPRYTTNTPKPDPPATPSSWWRRELGTGTPGAGGPQGVMGSDIGYRIDNATTGGNFVDMYISWAALGYVGPSPVCVIWATDINNPNLDQAPSCDSPSSPACVYICDVVADAGSDQSICAGGSVGIGGSPTATGGTAPYTYLWTPDTGLDDDEIANPTASPSSTTTYTVTVTDYNGCSDTDEVEVTVNLSPTVTITPDGGELTCTTTSITLTADTSSSPCTPITGYQWYVGTTALGTGSTQAATTAGTYKVVVTCENGCTGEDTAVVTENITNPTVTVTGDTVCVGDEATLTANPSGCTAGVSYQWYQGSSVSGGTELTGETGSTLVISNAQLGDAGDYTVEVTCDDTGCSGEGTGGLNVDPCIPPPPPPPPGRSCSFEINMLGEIVEIDVDCCNNSLYNTHRVYDPDDENLIILDRGTPVICGDCVGCGAYPILVEITEAEAEDLPPTPEDTQIVIAYNCDGYKGGKLCSHVTFGKPIVLLLKYDPDAVGDDEVVFVAQYDPELGEWIPLEPAGGIAGTGELRVYTSSFSMFAILAEPAPAAPPEPPTTPTTEPPAPAPEPPTAAHFVIRDLTVTPSGSYVGVGNIAFRVERGMNVAISTDITNDGGQSGNYNASLIINGKSAASRDITLGPGQGQEVTFTLSENKPGQYVIQIDDQKGEFTVVRWTNWPLIAGLVVAFGLLVWALWYLVYRRRRGKISEV
jgi:hypothetical protein